MAIGIKKPQNTATSELLYQRYGQFASLLKTRMTGGTGRILRKPSFSPSASERATLTKKARAAGVKAITFNERGWKRQSDMQTFRTAIVFCLKGRMGRSRIDRVNRVNRTLKNFCSRASHCLTQEKQTRK
ncbi:hypothetical protein AVEN_225919-1 [Araneus ventricosus]|uniref:Uncharacterized protein n=1 Tax=Araneus ventricosus TaxID=182803 RepID=A0A4Y2BD45_ARAVE|nr:hypothetical protein AVEN_225919-1 [Araneus ventricosus]